MKLGAACVLVGLFACGSEKAPAVDAASDIDATVDADAAIDAPFDAVEEMIDAPPSLSPTCTTTPTVLLETSPRRIGTMARSGSTLYVSAYEMDASDQPINSVVFTIDLTTGTQSVPPISTVGPMFLGATDGNVGDVFGAENMSDGSIWQFHPGAPPAEIIEHRDRPSTVTAEGGYVYWSEYVALGDPTALVKRRLITGNTVEAVMECEVLDLAVVGPNLYCAGFRGLTFAPKAGGAVEGVSFMNSGYPIVSVNNDGSSVSFVSLYPFPELFRATPGAMTATKLHQLPLSGRYAGLTASSDYLYTVELDRGIRRIDRTTLAIEHIYQGPANRDPVLWNNHLYFQAPNPQLSGDRYVMHCVD